MPIRGDMRFDKRIIERNIRVGLVTRREYEMHLKKLKDLSEDTTALEAELRHLDRQLPGTPETDEDEL